jgi:hypothetical protein
MYFNASSAICFFCSTCHLYHLRYAQKHIPAFLLHAFDVTFHFLKFKSFRMVTVETL